MSFVNGIIYNLHNKPDDNAFVFYDGSDENKFETFSYRDIFSKSFKLASWITEHSNKGDRIIIVLDSGIDFVATFLACILSGRIAVPAPKPIYGNHLERIGGIIEDCRPKIGICFDENHLPKMSVEHVLQVSAALECSLPEFNLSKIDPHSIAYLQYTSGSTQSPRGIMISQKNLVEQCLVLDEALGKAENPCTVGWLPLFHDFGLMMGVVHPLLRGFTSVMMSPGAFIKKPALWLKAISQWRGTYSGAPNFAFERCLDKLKPESLRHLDLRSLVTILNGAEPVLSSTLFRFNKVLCCLGMREDVVKSGYGLAESTLIVCSSKNNNKPIRRTKASLGGLNNNIFEAIDGEQVAYRTLVSCGKPIRHEVIIVGMKNLQEISEGNVGRILVQGKSNAIGYWNEKSDHGVFGIEIAGRVGKFIETGDLGFFDNGELFLCGRTKDVVTIRGANIHACDIEDVAQNAHPYIKKASGAFFSIEFGEHEQTVLLLEMSRPALRTNISQLREVAQIISRSVSEYCGLIIDRIVLLRSGIAKTSSGKIQRAATKRKFIEKKVAVLLDMPKCDTNIEKWLLEVIQAETISLDLEFRNINISDILRAKILDDLHKKFHVVMPITMFEEFTTPRKLIASIQEKVNKNRENQAQAAVVRPKYNKESDNRIAIIGMGCRFPKANSIREFWNLMCAGIDAISNVPEERWDAESLYNPSPLALGKVNCYKGGFIDSLDGLDREFFEISAREAIRMDPQHRLMMEVGWECFYSAGYTKKRLNGSRTSVFVGISGSDYAQEQFGDQLLADAYAGLGSALTLAASRLSHFLNLCGPALAIDTACSSSLSAVHAACASLRTGESQMSLVGGVNVILSPIINMSLTKAGMLSPDGKCKAFDQDANGYVRSEGVGAVLLKPLQNAIRDNDNIYGIICGSASNHDGRSSGISAPNGLSQEAVIKQACANAGILPEQIDYFEAHGTGTAIGDPTEANAIGAVISGKKVITPIGSVKTNIGHTESAAGMASLIKSCLMLSHKKIPPNLHFIKPNPLIDFKKLKIQIPTTLQEFTKKEGPFLIGVNSFGVGGTNVHLVLSEHLKPARQQRENAGLDLGFLLPLSSHSQKSLQTAARENANFLSNTTENNTYIDLLNTQMNYRDDFNFSAVAYGLNKKDLCKALQDYADNGFSDQVIARKKSATKDATIKPVFIFSGQGMQWPGMGKFCYESSIIFRQTVNQIDEILKGRLPFSVLSFMAGANMDISKFARTDFAQPIIFALQVSLARMWQSHGIKIEAVVGHSVGEIAAAHIAGILSLGDALDIILTRSQLMQKTEGQGLMASVDMDYAKLDEILSSEFLSIDIAAVNTSTSIVVSGAKDEMALFIEDMKRRNISVTIIPGNYAFHSRHMIPFAEELKLGVEHLSHRSPEIPFFSTVSGKLNKFCDSSYWVKNLCQPVLFGQTMELILKEGYNFLVEIGPSATLLPIAARIKNRLGVSGVSLVSSLRKGHKSEITPLKVLAQYVDLGGKLSENLFYGAEIIKTAPGFVFDRQKYWLNVSKKYQEKRTSEKSLLSKKLSGPTPGWEVIIENHYSHHIDEVLQDGNSWVTNGILIEMVIEALQETFTEAKLFTLYNILIQRSLPVPLREHPRLRVLISFDKVTIFSLNDINSDNWEKNLECKFSKSFDSALVDLGVADLSSYIENNELKVKQFYEILWEMGYKVSQHLQIIDKIYESEGRLLLGFSILESQAKYCMHPLLYEVIEHGCIYLSGLEKTKLSGFANIDFRADIENKNKIWVLVEQKNNILNAYILDEKGEVLVSCSNAIMQNLVCVSNICSSKKISSWLFDDKWIPFLIPITKKQVIGSLVIFVGSSFSSEEISSVVKNMSDEPFFIVQWGDYGRSNNIFKINPYSQADYDLLFRDISLEVSTDLTVLHLASIDITNIKEDIISDQEFSSLSILRILQAQLKSPAKKITAFIFVGEGMHTFKNELCVLNKLHHSTVWGMLRTLDIELPEIPFWRIDIDYKKRLQNLNLLMKIVATRPGEREFCIRDGSFWTSKMVQSSREVFLAGSLRPGLGQLEVSVEKLYYLDKESRPFAALGIVNAVGNCIENKKITIGTRVVFIYSGELTSHWLVESDICKIIPEGLCIEEFGQVFKILYLLEAESKLISGQKLLLVDPSLIEAKIAQVYCQRIQNEGPYILTSPAHKYKKFTGTNADRIINLGFSDDNNSEPLISDNSIDTAIVFGSKCDSQRFALYLKDGARIIHFDEEEIKPVLGCSYRRLSCAFVMQRLESIFSDIADSTLCVLQNNFKKISPSANLEIVNAQPLLYDPDGTYIISGGTGGLGLEIAKRMAQNGAGHLVLLSRNGANSAIESDINCIKNLGASVLVLALDICEKQKVVALIDHLKNEGKFIKGVVHAAATLSNGLVQNVSTEEFLEPLRAKMLGALFLHEALIDIKLDFFVMFSSLSSQIGSRGQANYACGNAFLDALANYRVINNMSALSISWGPWAEKGMASKELNIKNLSKGGFAFIPLSDGLDILESALMKKEQGHFSVLPMDWAKYSVAFPAAKNQTFLSELLPSQISGQVSMRNSFSLDTFMHCKNSQDRLDLLIDMLKGAINRCFKSEANLDVDTEIGSLGLDSIISLELKSRIDNALGMPIDTALILRGPTIQVLARHCLDKLEIKEAN